MEDGNEEEGPFAAWLPPDDRLWRHPSELRRESTPRPATSRHRIPEFRLWAVAIVAGVIGASLAAGVGMATGSYHSTTIHPVERVIEEPTTATLVSKNATASVLQLAAQVRSAVVELDFRSAHGDVFASGVVFSSDGLVITDNHLLAGVKSITALLADGRWVRAHVVGGDAETDIAVVKFAAPTHQPVATLDAASTLQPGQMTVAVGSSPAGTQVTAGVVRTVKGALNPTSPEPLLGLIEFDTQVDPVATGGALINSTGAVVGITTAASSPRPATSLGYAVPSSVALDVADQIITTGHVAHSWLGVRGQDTTAPDNNRLGISGGALIETVDARSPAALGGLRRGDVVTAVANTAVTSMDDLIGALRQMHSGQQVTLTLLRNGKARTAVVTLGRQPPS
jgi:S1-C subfamily serine protease